MYQVLLVDHRPEYLKMLRESLDWQELGFVISMEAESEDTAIKGMKETMADVAFVNLELLKSDGLVLGNKLMKVNARCEIVLFSSGRHFEYAHEALLSGFSDYLLEEELSGEPLRLAVKKIYGKLKKKDLEMQAKIRQLLTELLENQISNESLHSYLQEFGGRFCSLFLCADQPLPLLKLPEEERVYSFHPALETVEGIQILDVRQISVMKWSALLCFDGTENTDDWKEAVGRVVQRLRKQFFAQIGKSCTIIISAVYDDIYEYPAVINAMRSELPDYFWNADTSYGGVLGEEKLPDFTKLYAIVKDVNWNEIETIHTQVEGILSLLPRVMQGKSRAALLERMQRLCQALEERRRLKGLLEYSAQIREQIFDQRQWHGLYHALCWLFQEISDQAELLGGMETENFHPITNQAIACIRRRFQENLTIMDVARELNISGAHLRRVFKKDTEKSIKAFLDDYRIQQAILYMQTKRYHVYQVADMCGFTSGQYFSTVFKNKVGVTPHDYIAKL